MSDKEEKEPLKFYLSLRGFVLFYFGAMILTSLIIWVTIVLVTKGFWFQ